MRRLIALVLLALALTQVGVFSATAWAGSRPGTAQPAGGAGPGEM